MRWFHNIEQIHTFPFGHLAKIVWFHWFFFLTRFLMNFLHTWNAASYDMPIGSSIVWQGKLPLSVASYTNPDTNKQYWALHLCVYHLWVSDQREHLNILCTGPSQLAQNSWKYGATALHTQEANARSWMDLYLLDSSLAKYRYIGSQISAFIGLLLGNCRNPQSTNLL